MLLVVLLLAGCVGGNLDGSEAGAHGDAVRVTGDVSVARDGDRFVASRDVTMTNGYAEAIFADLRLSTLNGGVSVGTCRCGSYEFVASLQAAADTESEARARLATLSVDSTDKRSGQLLAIWVEASSAGNKWNDREVSMTLMLPEELIAADSEFDTTNGLVRVSGLRTENLQAVTTNGGVDVAIRPAGEGRLDLFTTNGNIALEVLPPTQPLGVDVRASTVNGMVDLDFADVEPVGQQSPTEQRVRSLDYDDIGLKLDARLSTVNGSITAAG